MRTSFAAAFAALALSAAAPALAGSADKLRLAAPAGTEKLSEESAFSVILYTGLAIGIVIAAVTLIDNANDESPTSP
jgi:ABC-type enterobactin transport system permease subunit